ncbi:hypothetical protein EDB89DRAFT_2003294, partial [Lactarius sanguifluus]
IIGNRESKLWSGTSCSVPTAAGFISLLNDYLVSRGRAPPDFLNTWLYGGSSAGLNGITSSGNPGCGTHGLSTIAGGNTNT